MASDIARDRWFFRTEGIRRLIGFRDIYQRTPSTRPLPPIRADAELLMLRLDGEIDPYPLCCDIGLGQNEPRCWLQTPGCLPLPRGGNGEKEGNPDWLAEDELR